MSVFDTWRYKLQEDFLLEFHNSTNISFSSEWFTIDGNVIRIKAGYAWNGCNPAFMVTSEFLGVSVWVGTPDGPVDPDTQLPQTWKASLVHDAFCQYRLRMNGVTKRVTVDLFKSLLLECGFPQWKADIYANAVNVFGPQKWK